MVNRFGLRVDVNALDAHELERCARELLDAMDRQHGSAPFSVHVQAARLQLRAMLPVQRDESDRAERNRL